MDQKNCFYAIDVQMLNNNANISTTYLGKNKNKPSNKQRHKKQPYATADNLSLDLLGYLISLTVSSMFWWKARYMVFALKNRIVLLSIFFFFPASGVIKVVQTMSMRGWVYSAVESMVFSFVMLAVLTQLWWRQGDENSITEL